MKMEHTKFRAQFLDRNTETTSQYLVSSTDHGDQFVYLNEDGLPIYLRTSIRSALNVRILSQKINSDDRLGRDISLHSTDSGLRLLYRTYRLLAKKLENPLAPIFLTERESDCDFLVSTFGYNATAYGENLDWDPRLGRCLRGVSLIYFVGDNFYDLEIRRIYSSLLPITDRVEFIDITEIRGGSNARIAA